MSEDKDNNQTVDLTEELLEQLIADLRPVFLKYGLDLDYFDRAFRKSEIRRLIMEQIEVEKREAEKKPNMLRYKFKNTKWDVEHMKELRAKGLTLREISEMYGISQERVRQITYN